MGTIWMWLTSPSSSGGDVGDEFPSPGRSPSSLHLSLGQLPAWVRAAVNVLAVSSVTVPVSLTAVGASLISVTVTDIVAELALTAPAVSFTL